MRTFVAAALTTFALATGPSMAQETVPEFGSEEEVAFAEQLWELMESQRLVGPNMIRAFPYEGTQPHGMMLETFYTKETINGHTGDLIVKRNYGPEGVSVDEILSNPGQHLGAYTIMFRREAGYDPENKDWFWVRYGRSGALSKAGGKGMAGRLQRACIACHQAVPDDLVFTTDHLLEN